jgi:hypothetical protein
MKQLLAVLVGIKDSTLVKADPKRSYLIVNATISFSAMLCDRQFISSFQTYGA